VCAKINHSPLARTQTPCGKNDRDRYSDSGPTQDPSVSSYEAVPEGLLLHQHLVEVHALVRKQNREIGDLREKIAVYADGPAVIKMLREDVQLARGEIDRLHEEIGRRESLYASKTSHLILTQVVILTHDICI